MKLTFFTEYYRCDMCSWFVCLFLFGFVFVLFCCCLVSCLVFIQVIPFFYYYFYYCYYYYYYYYYYYLYIFVPLVRLRSFTPFLVQVRFKEKCYKLVRSLPVKQWTLWSKLYSAPVFLITTLGEYFHISKCFFFALVELFSCQLSRNYQLFTCLSVCLLVYLFVSSTLIN